MKVQVVVARYNESVDWLQPIQDKCLFINKGEPLNLPNEVRLENLGRESDSYLWYIIENYDSLPDVVAFTQGDISDHRNGSPLYKVIETMIEEAAQYTCSRPHTMHTSRGPNVSCYDADFNYRPSWDKHCKDEFWMQNNYKNNRPIRFSLWLESVVGKEYKSPFLMYTNAIFAVHKNKILKYSKEFYQRLRDEVHHHVNPTEGHFMERTWFLLYNVP